MADEIRKECVESLLNNLGSDLLGEMLTIVDAIVPERHRLNAAKSLVKQALWKRINEYKNTALSLAELQKEMEQYGKTD